MRSPGPPGTQGLHTLAPKGEKKTFEMQRVPDGKAATGKNRRTVPVNPRQGGGNLQAQKKEFQS